MPNSLVSGYNSLDPTDTDHGIKIGTVSIAADRIPLGPGTVVEGDIFVGVGGDPASVIGAGGTVQGRKFAMTEDIDFPDVEAPTLPDMGTDLSAKGATITLGTTGWKLVMMSVFGFLKLSLRGCPGERERSLRV